MTTYIVRFLSVFRLLNKFAAVSTLLLFIFASISQAAQGLTYQGKIIKSDGTPLTGASVQFQISVLSPGAERCLLYQETQNVNLTASNGTFSMAVGTGTRVAATVDAGHTFKSIFSNRFMFDQSTAPSACAVGTSYTPVSTDHRILKVSFYDGSAWQVLPDQTINQAPNAIEAQQIGGYAANQIIRVDATTPTTATEMSAVQFARFLDLMNLTLTNNQYAAWDTSGSGTWKAVSPLAVPTCAGGQVLFGNGTTLSCVAPPGGAPSGAAGGDLAGTYPNPTVATVGAVTAANVASGANLANAATNLNTASTIVKRDASGNFTAGTITANLTGTATNFSGALAGDVTGTQGATVISGLARSKLAAGTANQVLVNDGAGAMSGLTLTNGQLLIGSTGAAPVAASLTAGAGITITPAAGGITIAAAAGGGTVTSVTSANADIGVATTTTTPVLTLNSGTGANQIVKLTAASKYPAVDGSLITNLDAGNISAGTLPVARGGTGATSFANYSAIASNGSGNQVAVPGSTANTMLQWTVAGPTWSTATFPATTTANQLLYSSATNTVAGLATAANSVLTTNGSSVPSFVSTLPATVGGTGQTGYAVGDLLYASTTTALSKLPATTSGYVLTSNGAGTAPSWQVAAGGVSGSGTTGKLPKWSSSTGLGDSVITESSGNIGIGTTGPTAGLHVATAGVASTPAARLNGAWYTGGTATTTKPQLLVEPSTATSTSWATTGTGLGVNAASGFTGNLIDLQINGSSRFNVDANGAYASGNFWLNPGQALKFGSVGSTQIVGSGINSGADYLSLKTANTTRIHIDNTGNVGIGTTTQDGSLTIDNPGGHDAFNVRRAGTELMYIDEWGGVHSDALNVGGGTALGGRATFQDSGTVWPNIVGIGQDDESLKALSILNQTYNANPNNGFRFWQTNAGVARLGNAALADPAGISIGTTGNVGIGSATPGYKLDVAGDVNISGNFRVNGTIIGGGSGTVTTVSSANADIVVATGTTTPVLTLNSGTGASQIVKLTAASKYPAVDGSLITNLDAGNIATGTLPVARGGTGATSFANYSAIASNGSGNQVAVPGSTANTMLQWTVAGPAWSTATFPATTTANQLLYSSANNVVGGLATAANSVLTTNGSSVPSFVSTLPATVGGTGQTGYAVGDILYASTTTALSKLPATTSGYVLTSNGAGTAPSWQAAAGGISGSGTTGKLPKWSSSTGLGDSVIQESSSKIGIGGAPVGSNVLSVVGGNASINGLTVGIAPGSGTLNTVVGNGALAANTTGTGNQAFGPNALMSNTTGGANSAFGSGALQLTTIGSNNTALGYGTNFYSTDSDGNTSVGSFAMFNPSGGDYNVAIGFNAMKGSAGSQGANASDNVAVGYGALTAVTSGNSNTAIGSGAGNTITTGTSNILLGFNVQATSATSSNQLNIGNTLYGDLSSGKIGIGTSAPTNNLGLAGDLDRAIGIERNSVTTTTGNTLRIVAGAPAAAPTTNNLDGGNLVLSAGTSQGTGTSTILFRTATAGASGSADNSPNNKMAIIGNGNVGIGSMTPGYKLDVAGDVNVSGNFRVNGTIIGGGSGTVTTVSSANADIGVATGTTTPVLTLNSGTGANQIVKLTAASKYPAVDGSLITNLDAGNISAGTLPVARGGTGATSFANYSAIASNGSGNQVAVPGSTANTMLQWTVTGPAWSTATFPATTTANQLLYSSATNTVAGLATAANSVLTTNGSSVPSFVSSLPATVGGTGQTGYAVGDVLYASTTTALSRLPATTSGYVLTSNGAGAAPSWQVAAGGISGSGTTGKIPKWSSGSALTNSLLSESGSVVSLNGSLDLPTTTSSVGQITMGGTRVFHSYGTENIFVGLSAGNFTTTGGYSVSLDYNSLVNNTSGNANVAIGDQALRYNTTGGSNTAVGTSLAVNTTGSYNTGVGTGSLGANVTGIDNTALGYSVLANNTGSENTGVGESALGAITTGSYNAGLGRRAGYYASTSSSNNVFIGAGAGPSSSTTLSNTLWIANAAGTPLIYGDFAAGSVGIGTTTPGFGSRLDVVGSVGGSSTTIRALSGGSTDYAGIAIGRTTDEGYFGVSAGPNIWYTGSVAGDIALKAGGGRLLLGSNSAAPAMTMLSSGNVGIGTTAPVDRISIGVAPTASATHALLNLSNTALSSGSANGTYIGANPASFTGDFMNFQVANTSVFAVNNYGAVTATNQFNSVGGGNNAYASSGATFWPGLSNSEFNAVNYSYGDNNNAGMTFQVSNAAGKNQGAYIAAVAVTGASTYTPSLVFGASTGTSSYQEFMRINSSGNVGIGTSTPGYKLDVVGDVNVSGNFRVNGTIIGGGSGTVTTVTSANADIGVATGTTTPVLTLNSGTGANQIVKLTAASKYPAVDGSLITNLDAGNIATGTLPVARGGTGATSFANYSAIASNGSGNQVAVPGSTANTMLQWTVTGPAWSTATFPATTTANQLLYSSATNTVAGLATAANSVLTTNGSSVPSFVSTLPATVGGTGQTVYTVGDILYASSTTALSKLAAGTNGFVLKSNGAGTAPSWTSNSAANSFVNGGNSFSGAATLGTNDGYGLSLKTNGNTYFTIDNTGRAAFNNGTSTSSIAHVYVPTQNMTNTTGSDTGVYVDAVAAPGSSSSGSYKGITSTVQSDPTSAAISGNLDAVSAYASWGSTANLTGRLQGGYFSSVNNAATTTINETDAVTATTYNQGTGTVNAMVGVSASTDNMTTGTVGTAYGVRASVSKTAGTVTTGYGLYSNVTATTTGYGLYIPSVTAATKYSIYASDANAPSYFAAKVGIGTTTPAGILDVRGGTAAASTSGTDINITAQNSGTGNFNGGSIVLSAGAKSGTGKNGTVKVGCNGCTDIGPVGRVPEFIVSENGTGEPTMMFQDVSHQSALLGFTSGFPNSYFAIASENASLGIQFKVNGSYAGDYINTGSTTAMTIVNTGYVGVGTTNPGYPLDVVGTIRATDILLTSDRRKKYDIQSLSNSDSLEQICKVRPVSFKWIGSEKPDEGVIAQELREIFPQLVVENPDGSLSVRYTSLIAPLIGSIQQLNTQNQQMSREIASLKISQETRMKKLEDENKQLHDKLDLILKSLENKK